MTMRFLRGNSQAPKGHAILIARSATDSRVIYSTYCLVPPIPMSLAKYLPPLFAAQIPAEDLQDATNLTGMPIPPMLEEAFDLDYLELLAEHRDDDLCDIGPISSKDEVARMQLATTSSQEYGQLYSSYLSTLRRAPTPTQISEPVSLDEVDAEELLLQTMPDRQKLAELGKLVGTARYAMDGHDTALLQETKRKMQRFANLLADKYRGKELVAAATDTTARGARLAELYLKRAYKLLDEEYADIPDIERAIRELQE
jgi:predicted MarR family transcription regulator